MEVVLEKHTIFQVHCISMRNLSSFCIQQTSFCRYGSLVVYFINSVLFNIPPPPVSFMEFFIIYMTLDWVSLESGCVTFLSCLKVGACVYYPQRQSWILYWRSISSNSFANLVLYLHPKFLALFFCVFILLFKHVCNFIRLFMLTRCKLIY